MNEYYHAFNIGFNFWFVTGPLLVILVAALGFITVCTKATKKGKKPIIYLHYTQKPAQILIGILTALFVWEVGSESGAGLVQTFDNGLSKYESPVWSLFGAAFTLVIIAIVMYMILFFVYRIVQDARKKYLTAIYKSQVLGYKHSSVKFDRDLLELQWRNAVLLLYNSISEPNEMYYSLYDELKVCDNEEDAKAIIANYARKMRGDDAEE